MTRWRKTVDKEGIAIVTGSFDPITRGHVEIVREATRRFDRVYVVALSNAEKQHLFSSLERKEMIRLATEGMPNVVADAYDGMTADYMHANGITTIVRGVRNETDRTYETDLAARMKAFDPAFETVLIAASGALADVSSTLVRERIREGKDVCDVVPDGVASYIKTIRK